MNLKLATLILSTLASGPLTAQWLDLKTPGIPRTPDGAPNLAAPVPRTADGRPELTGLWRGAGSRGDLRDATKPQAWAREAMGVHESNYYRDGPHMQCLPQGPSYLTGAGGGGGNMRRIVQSPTVIAILNPDLTYRQIFTDGRTLEADPLPIWQGYSVGRWDGDTLVVESNGYNAKTWLHPEGLQHTEQLRITERWQRTDFGHMQVEITYTDPGTFAAPLRHVVNLEYAADDEMLELVCNEASEGGVKHWVGDKVADAHRTAVQVAPAILERYVGRYEGIWLDNPTRVEVTLENGKLLLSRNGSEKDELIPQSETAFVCPTCQWGQPYMFVREGNGMATEIREVQVSGAWVFKRVQ
jgi:hypothetical protein